MSCVHEIQRHHAQIAMMCCGRFPMRADPHWFGVFYEDDNVYHIEISDEYPGPSVRLSVGRLSLDCWPALTIERAEKRARELAFGPEQDTNHDN
jgi:hypothetical protein